MNAEHRPLPLNISLARDHPCPDCGVLVYSVISKYATGSGWLTRRKLDAATSQPHTCSWQPVAGVERPRLVRCPDCRLSVYACDGELYNDDAATGLHTCEYIPPVLAPLPVAPAPAVVKEILTTASTAQPLRGRVTPGQLRRIRELRAQIGIMDTSDLPSQMGAQEAADYLTQLEGEVHAPPGPR